MSIPHNEYVTGERDYYVDQEEKEWDYHAYYDMNDDLVLFDIEESEADAE